MDLSDDLRRALGRAWADDFPWTFLTELTELGSRMAGHPGELRSAELVADALRDAGARDVTLDSFPIQVWTRGDTRLAVTDPVERSFEAIALPYCPQGDVTAELVDVGHGTPAEIDDAEVAGKVALATTESPRSLDRFLHRMEKFGHAAAAGAEAFVFANHKEGQHPPTGSLRFDQEAAIPGVGVSHETGEWLREYAERGGRVAIEVDARTERGESHNAHGVFGPDGDSTDEEIVLVAHHDAHDIAEGALDNGCGITTAVAAARLLADVEDELDCRVRVAGVGSEEVGLLGSDALAEKLDLRNVKAVVNADGAGRYRTLRAFTHGNDAFEEPLDAVSEATNRPVAVESNLHPFSDHWPFLRRGVPAVQLHSVTPERGRGWGHTHADTRDKADGRNLREHAMLTALLVLELSRREVPRVDEHDLRAGLEGRGFEPGMQAADIWPETWD
ncbi:M28 family metallopeptidase [Halospeciosus flavus]|uniref:Carboxypeptidase Q n=1 Tax=Halospeciosus flavus TaxID=3032283 RepID=A0ABD5Z872_9EURY|nr:M28 family metallopeptidase [Halospeciosus flavus]